MNTEENKEASGPERFLAMPAVRLTIEIVGYASSTVTLPDDVAAWVIEVSDMAHAVPAALCASIVGDVSRDDREMHHEPQVLQ